MKTKKRKPLEILSHRELQLIRGGGEEPTVEDDVIIIIKKKGGYCGFHSM
ncbi:MAG: hypothetical protein JXJ22_08715 [Bacteroidales bacterium]|nr:hypothetical protein [Bacteroidales bacterium]